MHFEFRGAQSATVTAAARCIPALMLLGLVLGVAGCSTLRVTSDYDRSASFAGFHNVAWLAREHHGTSNPLIQQRAHDAIQAELTGKGFSFVADSAAADFVVDFTIGSQDRLDVNSYPLPYGGPWYWADGGWWGTTYWGPNVDVHQYREGTLSIDVFDGRTHRAVWHGRAQKDLTSADIANSEGPIRTAVQAVLAQFPPK